MTEQKKSGNYQILIVDDDKSLCRIIQKNLQKSGFQTSSISSGVDVITWATNNNTNTLMLLDYVLPDMSGKQVVKSMAESQCSNPFIIMTGHGDQGLAVEMMKLGAQDYLVKDKNFLEFLPMVVKKTVEHLTAEDQIRKLSRAVEQSPSMVMITDIDGDIEYVNPKFSRLTGYNPEEVVGKNPSIMKSGQTTQNEYKRLWDSVASGSEWHGEFHNKKKNGEFFWESASISAIKNDKGIITHYIKVAEDITKRKETEDRLLQAEKLRSLGVMASGIAHDFNNILAIVQGNAQLMISSHGDHTELKEGLRTICRAAHDGAEIVRRMHEFTRVKGNVAKYATVDIGKLIEEAIDFSKPRWISMAHTKGIDYDINLDGVEPGHIINGHPSELREVFVNMINNALDAMPEGGRLSFLTWGDKNDVYVRISDDGEGMSRDVKKRIFDPFFSTKGVKGTGLGMSTVYGIVARHGGKIDVKSEIGNGSMFTLRFPIYKETGSPVMVSPETIKGLQPKDKHILVADDVQDIREMMMKFLSNEGYNVKSVSSGDEAINLLKKESYDLLLCDLSMPDLSGSDVLKVVKGFDNRPKVGVITGSMHLIESLRKEDIGEDFIIEKPIDLLKLSKIIKEVLVEPKSTANEKALLH